MKKLKRTVFTLVVLATSMSMAYAQNGKPVGPPNQKQVNKKIEVSDQEVSTFASIYQEVNTISQSAQQEMIKKVQNNGFQVKKFQMMQKKQQKGESLEVSDEKKEKFQQTNQAIQKIQQNTQKQAMSAIKDGGMTLQRYQTIMQQLRQDQALQKRVKAKLAPKKGSKKGQE